MNSHWWSKLGALLGSAMAIMPVLGAIPGASQVVNVIVTVIGVGITLVTQFQKVITGTPK